MEIAAPSNPSRPLLKRATEQFLEAWRVGCKSFLAWQYDEVLSKRASPEVLADHRATLKWWLWVTRMLHAQILHPEYPARQYLPEVEGKLGQLEKSWEMVHNPMSDEEANRILGQAFPDESRAGSFG